MERVCLTDRPIEVAGIIAATSRPEAGAIALFFGTVRNEAEGRAVTLLEYEAYAPMAVAEMQRCVDEIEAKFPDVRLSISHRVGSLHVGDAAVVCAASAPHRDNAFVACRELIDAVKSRAPIWKREHGPNGAYWVGWQDARCDGTTHDHDHRHHDHDHDHG